MNGFDLTGKVTLVTGGAKRIGREIALRLHREGALVAIHYGGSRDQALETASACGNAPIFRANLERVPEIVDLFEQVGRHFGRIDALVNNAARFTRFHPLDVTEADWDYIHSVNLKAVFFCCQQGAKWMLRNPDGAGRIVNLSSLGGIRPWAMHAHYCASKAGVIHMTKALAKAFAPGITVNSVAPGVITFEAGDEEALSMVRATPAGRPGTGAEVAEAVVSLLRASNFVTGQLIAVDGGLSLR